MTSVLPSVRLGAQVLPYRASGEVKLMRWQTEGAWPQVSSSCWLSSLRVSLLLPSWGEGLLPVSCKPLCRRPGLGWGPLEQGLGGLHSAHQGSAQSPAIHPVPSISGHSHTDLDTSPSQRRGLRSVFPCPPHLLPSGGWLTSWGWCSRFMPRFLLS